MNRLIICGSPRPHGRSAHLAEELFDACIEECPDDQVSLASVASLDIAPCRACDACRESENHACALDDDMAELRELIDDADELVVVSPVYFAGPPAQLKALIDRLQPYFWSYERGGAKRPAVLHVVGEGGDPRGFEPLVGIVRSALAVAGFALERVYDWVGKIDEDGQITAEADARDLGAGAGVGDAAPDAGAASAAGEGA